MINCSGRYKILLFAAVIAVCSVSCRTTKIANKPVSTDNSDFYKKYSKTLGVELLGNEDKKFIEAIAGWLGTPYLYGGETKKGTDCSGLVKTLFKDVYDLNLYRTAYDLVKNCDPVGKRNLKTGDLVFFKINSDKISHVGIYIDDGKFIHASSKGVIISDLSEAYYTKYYYSAGRIKGVK